MLQGMRILQKESPVPSWLSVSSLPQVTLTKNRALHLLISLTKSSAMGDTQTQILAKALRISACSVFQPWHARKQSWQTWQGSRGLPPTKWWVCSLMLFLDSSCCFKMLTSPYFQVMWPNSKKKTLHQQLIPTKNRANKTSPSPSALPPTIAAAPQSHKKPRPKAQYLRIFREKKTSMENQGFQKVWSIEQGSKPVNDIPLYWLVHWNPYNGLL